MQRLLKEDFSRRDAVESGAGGMQAALTMLLVFSCFTFASSGYLGWLYRLIEVAPAGSADALALGAGYACQGAGVAMAAALMRFRPGVLGRMTLIAAIVAHFACAVLATMGEGLAMALAFGCAMNVLCGFVSAFYLFSLSAFVRAERRGIVFGGGYACSVVVTWLLSMVPSIGPVGAPNELVWCAVFSIAAIAVAIASRDSSTNGAFGGPHDALPSQAHAADTAGSRASSSENQTGKGNLGWSVIALACGTVLLMSTVKNVGFNFPSADIGQTINLELSRLLYAVGLVIAGLVVDRSRKYGAVLCLAALFMPFAMLALSSEPIPSAALWAVDYLFYGFFSVFRVVLFADLAEWENRFELSGFGLMFGRFGDGLGAIVCLTLAGRAVALVIVAGVLFIATIFAFVRLFQQLYMDAPSPLDAQLAAEQASNRAAQRAFIAFAERYDLSPRERDVLRLMLDKHTNPEMANDLTVSENTVKFHVRNVLKKTGCKNRVELLAKFQEETRD